MGKKFDRWVTEEPSIISASDAQSKSEFSFFLKNLVSDMIRNAAVENRRTVVMNNMEEYAEAALNDVVSALQQKGYTVNVITKREENVDYELALKDHITLEILW